MKFVIRSWEFYDRNIFDDGVNFIEISCIGRHGHWKGEIQGVLQQFLVEWGWVKCREEKRNFLDVVLAF